MKKRLVLLIFVFALVGCTKENNYDELEKRFDLLEQRIEQIEKAIDNKDYQQTSSNSQDATETNNTDTTLIDDIFNTEPQKTIYSLDNMTAEQIANECKYYFELFSVEKNIISDSFSDLFKVKPEKVLEYNSQLYALWGDAEINSLYSLNSSKFDEIVYIAVDSKKQMDGSIDLKNNIEIQLTISDYNKTVEVYDIMESYFFTLYQKQYVQKDGTNWSSYVTDGSFTFPAISLIKTEKDYLFTLTNKSY